MNIYAYRAFLDRPRLSKNWILEFYASLVLGKLAGLWLNKTNEPGKKKYIPNPNAAVIQNSDKHFLPPTTNNSGKLWDPGKQNARFQIYVMGWKIVLWQRY